MRTSIVSHLSTRTLRSVRSDSQQPAANVRRTAFSYIELLAVVVIIGVLTAAAVPAYLNSLVFTRIESAARRVKVDLELARQTARLTSATQTVTFVGSTYTMSAGVTGLITPTSTYAVNLAAAPYEITSVTANFGGTGVVSFNGYGTANTNGTVVLTAPRCQCTVTLNATTGQITISRANSGGRAPE